MEKNWNKKISNNEILLKLIKYRKLWFNHVTFLWWEPFIQENFLFSLKTAKKLWYIILVTTNASTLEIEKQSKKYLSYIDELILSIHAINDEIYKKIHKIWSLINLDKVFENINKFWKWNLLKINTIINPYNLDEIFNIFDYLKDKNIDEISLTFPDVYQKYYSEKEKKENIFVNYSKLKWYIELYYKKAIKNNINIKIADIPFCCLWKKELYKLTDDYWYSNRLKINYNWDEQNRNEISPRNRRHIKECNKCKFNNICWWPSLEYIKLFWDKEINHLI